MYDLIIIGGGPAGMAAAIYAARKKMNTLVLTRDIGGQTLWSGEIDNYLGFQLMSGTELAEKFRAHIKRLDSENALYDLEVKEGIEVKEVRRAKYEVGDNKRADGFEVETTAGEKYLARMSIIASGKIPRKLNIPGENEFLGRGVTYCATCDAPLFRGKDVAVIGGGNSALDAAIQLIKIASKTYLININSKLGGDAVMREQVEAKKDKVEILNAYQAAAIKGNKFVTSLEIKEISSGKIRSLAAQGVFIEIGSVPSTSFIKNMVKLNEWGEIIIDSKNNATSCLGIYAAGDVTDVREKQIVIAAGEGAKAALGAYDYWVRQN